jgi:nucleoside-triphosphatase THEP1
VSDRLLGLVLARLASPTGSHAVIVGGPVGAGKTRAAERLASALREVGVSVGGIVAPRIQRGAETVGYDVQDLVTGSRARLASIEPPGKPVGRFFLSEEGLQLAAGAIRRAAAQTAGVIVVEVGPAELAGQGHAAAVAELLGTGGATAAARRAAPGHGPAEPDRAAQDSTPEGSDRAAPSSAPTAGDHARPRALAVLTVRASLLEAVRDAFGLRDAAVFMIEDE